MLFNCQVFVARAFVTVISFDIEMINIDIEMSNFLFY